MDFRMKSVLPVSPDKVWPVMVDIGRIASCIPGLERVDERETLKLYHAVMKQKVGPFKLEVPATIVVEEHAEPDFLRARAQGRDKFTGTTMDAVLHIRLASSAEGGTRLDVEATLQIAGRLASLGYSIIKKKAEENFAEFETRLRSQLEEL
jgi:carbon monoxide dehydrogenase subunit G